MKIKRVFVRAAALVLAACMSLAFSSCVGSDPDNGETGSLTVPTGPAVTTNTPGGDPADTRQTTAPAADPGTEPPVTGPQTEPGTIPATEPPVTGPQMEPATTAPATEPPVTGPQTEPGTSAPVTTAPGETTAVTTAQPDPPAPHVHTFGNWETVKAPGCTQSGERVRRCTGCSYTESETLPAAGHVTGDWISELAPDGERDGQVGHCLCTVCGEWLDTGKNVIPEADRMIKARNITVNVRCYSGEELIFTTSLQFLQRNSDETIAPPSVEYYDASGVVSQTVKINDDRTVDFKGYKAVYKVISGSVSGNGNSSSTGAENTLALRNKLDGNGTVTVSVTAVNTARTGVVFNYTVKDGKASYYWFYTNKANGSVNLAKVTNGDVEILYSNYLSADYNVNNATESKIVLKDGKAYCWFWNTLIAVYEVGSEGGGYGIAADASGVKFTFSPLDKSAEIPKVDTLLFGHSYFAWWNNFYHSNLSSNMSRIDGIGSWADIAIGGSIASHWNKYQESILTYRPSLGIYMIGINDISSGVAPSEVAANVETLLLNIKKEIPEFRAVLMGVNHCSARTSINDLIAEINREYKFIAAAYDWIYFADIEYDFCDGSGEPVSGKFSDGLHPTEASFSSIITPAIISALKGEDQPDPAVVLEEERAGLQKKIDGYDIARNYPGNQALIDCANAVAQAKNISELRAAFGSFMSEIRKADSAAAISIMDDIFSNDRSIKSGWDAVVNNVKTWTHVPGTDYVIVNHERIAGWQLTKRTFTNFEMTVRVDEPTPLNPYVSRVTRSFLFGAYSGGSYPGGYALTIYKNGTDCWIQLHSLDGTGVVGTFLGGLYGDFTDKEVTFAVEDGRFYLRLNGNPTAITNAQLSGTVPYIPLDGYGLGGSIGILSWDSGSTYDAKMSIVAFRETAMSYEQTKSIVDAYVNGLNAGVSYAGDPEITGLIAQIAQATTAGELERLYARLVEAVDEADRQNAAGVMDAMFSDDNSVRSDWDAVVNNVKSWTHTPGTNSVTIDHTRIAGWQLTKQIYKDFEMTVTVDEPTPRNPYGNICTRSFLFGVWSGGNYPGGYALTIYKNGTDCWIQLHYLDGTKLQGTFLGGLYGDFTGKEVTFAVENGRFYLRLNGNPTSMTNASLNGSVDYITLDNYGEGGSIGILSWDSGSTHDAVMAITKFRLL